MALRGVGFLINLEHGYSDGNIRRLVGWNEDADPPSNGLLLEPYIHGFQFTKCIHLMSGWLIM